MTELIDSRYEIVRILGEGGMGKVFLVHDNEKDVTVALKTIRPEIMDDEAVSAFKAEFASLAVLDHPNLGKVYDFGIEKDGTRYFTMEFVAGEPIGNVYGKNRDFSAIMDCSVQICSALDYIHQRDIVHFDLKPDNILIEEKGKVKLIDFGLASRVSSGEKIAAKGTLEYMAPEMLLGEVVDARADLYSLGIILYELLSGKLPFEKGESVKELVEAVTNSTFSPITEEVSGIPENFARLIGGLIKKDRDLRIPTARECIDFLQEGSISDIVSFSQLANREKECELIKKFLQNREKSKLTVFIEAARGHGKSVLLAEYRKECQLSETKVYFIDCIKLKDKKIPLLRKITEFLLSDIEKKETLFEEKSLSLIERIVSLPDNQEELSGNVLSYANVMSELFSFNSETALIIDDFHLADKLSQNIITAFAEQAANVKCLLVIAYEGEDDFSYCPPDGENNISVIKLEPFSYDEVEEYCKVALGNKEVPKTLIRWLFQKTYGIPALLVETLGKLAEKQTLCRSGGSWIVKTEELSDDFIVTSFDDKYNEILSLLSADEKELLKISSVFKFPFRDSFVLFEGENKSKLLLKLCNCGILTKKEDSFRFSEPRFRDFLYYSISEKERQRMHTAVASLLKSEKTFGKELNYHLSLGSNADDALKAALELCSSEELSPGEIIALCRAVLSEDCYSDHLMTPYLELLSVLLNHLRNSGSMDLCSQTVRNARKVFADNDSFQAALDFEEGVNCFYSGNMDDGEKYFKRGLEIRRKNNDYCGVAKHLSALGWVCSNKGDSEGAEKFLKSALENAKKIEDQQKAGKEQLVILNNLGGLYGSAGNLDEAEKCFKETLRLASAYREKVFMARAGNNLGVICEEKGRYKEAVKYYGDSLEIKKELGDKPGQAMTWENIGVIYEAMGKYQSAMDCYRKATDIFKVLDDKKSLAECLGKFGMIYFLMGYMNEALDSHRKVFQIAQELRDERLRVLAIAKMIGEYAILGEFGKAGELIELLKKEQSSDEITDYMGKIYRLESESIYNHMIGNTAGAYNMAGKALDLIEEKNVERMKENILLLLAELSLVSGKTEAFGRFMKTCRRLNEQSGSIFPRLKLEILEQKQLFMQKNKVVMSRLKTIRDSARDMSFKILEADTLLLMAESDLSSSLSESYLKEVERINNTLKIPHISWTVCLLKGYYCKSRGNSLGAVENFRNATFHIENTANNLDVREKELFLEKPVVKKVYNEIDNMEQLGNGDDETEKRRQKIYDYLSTIESSVMSLDKELKLYRQKLNQMEHVLLLSSRMQAINSTEELTNFILTTAIKISNSTKAAVMIKDNCTGKPELMHALSRNGSILSINELSECTTLSEEALQSMSAIVCCDIASDDSYRKKEYFLKENINSFICVPMICRPALSSTGGDTLSGTIYIESTSTIKSEESLLEYLTTFAFQAAAALMRTLSQK